MREYLRLSFRILTLVLILIIYKCEKIFAATGDTVVVHGFNNFHHANCNSGQAQFVFPPDSQSFYKIMLQYKLSCPGGGCDIYDRIAKLKVIKHTGQIDTTITIAPSFKVNGQVIDTFQFMLDTSYSYSFDTLTNQLDSTPKSSLSLVLYGDTTNPLAPTDTIIVWPLYYNQYLFDSAGTAIDSIPVLPDSTLFLTHDTVRTPFEVLEPYEIARVITPYGEGVTLWFDVSDYRPLLHDSVTLYTSVCGYSYGWLVTTDFYFIEGIPPMHPYKVVNLWNGTYQYGNLSNPIENHLPPITMKVDSQEVYTKVRLITTGHGFGCFPDENVAEFFDVTHHVAINGDTMPQHLWRSDCGRNPLYPQGAPGYTSTWFLKRANWCPGSFVTPHDFDATPVITAGDSMTLAYNFEPYTVDSIPSGAYPPEYYIQSQVIFYDYIQYNTNTALVAVQRPNGAFEYNRLNPVCQGYNPVVQFKNYGTDSLHSLVFHYGIDGNILGMYTWTGNLGFLDTSTVELPPLPFGYGSHTFNVYTDQPNGGADGFVYDDTLNTVFASTNIYNTNRIRLQLKTDGAPTESSWDLKDESGNILYSRGNFQNSGNWYIDTLFLSNGCYSLTLRDSFGDGICCYNGTGYFRVLNGATGVLMLSVNDFGEYYSMNFTIDYTLGTNDIDNGDATVFLYPNPANELVLVNTSFESAEVSVTVFDLSSRIVKTFEKIPVNDYSCSLDLSGISPGLYAVKISSSKFIITKKLMIGH